MSQEKKFIKQTVYSKTKVEDIMKDLHSDFITKRESIDMTLEVLMERAKTENIDILTVIEAVKKLLDTHNNSTKNIVSLLSVFQKSTVVDVKQDSPEKDGGFSEMEDEIMKAIKEAEKNFE